MEIRHRVYYYETDKMGRVYHANFLNWMDEARTEFVRKIGMSYKEMEDMGIFLPVSEIKIKYLNPVEYDENLRIKINLMELTKIKIHFKYEFYNDRENIKFAESESVNVFTDINGKIKRISEELFEKIKKVEE